MCAQEDTKNRRFNDNVALSRGIKEFTALAAGQQDAAWSTTELPQLGGSALQRAFRCNPILPVNSKQSRFLNPAVRGDMATPVGATGSNVRFARHSEGMGAHGNPGTVCSSAGLPAVIHLSQIRRTSAFPPSSDT
jgi:hypothetical protein